jgi:class 3 adenylate cyclase
MPAPADERKPVTVLFADLVGSTELATRHDPEQLRAMLAAFFGRCCTCPRASSTTP